MSSKDKSLPDQGHIKKELHRETNMLSVVSPCFNESKVIRLFYEKLKPILESLPNLKHEIVFVDDGSTDDTLLQLNQLAQEDPCVRVCSLSRNFGHQIALTAGLDFAAGNLIVMMDSDLQHPPEIIPAMIQKWRDGYDIVSAVRDSNMGDSWFKNVTSRWFYFILNVFSEIPIPAGVADFNLLSQRVHKALLKMPERNRFLRGMISWLGFNRAYICYTEPRRAAGKSKYTLWKMISLALDATFSFSSMPLRWATWIGGLISCFGFIYLLLILLRYFLLNDLVPGWASLIGVILIIGGCQLAFIGLIGQYLARVFEETKDRPMYILKQEPSQPSADLSFE